MEKTDEELFIESIRGDEDAFPRLVERYVKKIYSFVYRLVGGAEDAHDLTQEVFLKLWQNRQKYRPEGKFRAFLFRIAHNAAVDFLRKKKDIMFSAFEDEKGNNWLEESIADSAALPDELADRIRDKETLDALLAQIPPAYREVLVLHYSDDLIFEEIGEIVGRPLNTVKSQHRRALALLRKLLDEGAPKLARDSY